MPYRFLFERKTIAFFLSLQFGQLGLFFVVWYALFPQTLVAQLEKGAPRLLIAFLLFQLIFCFFEYFVHRYVLHLHALSLFHSFSRKHNAHHGLTPVHATRVNDTTVVINAFPILEDSQREYSVFPEWALLGFSILMTPLIFLLQWLLPSLPILLGGYSAVFFSYVGYEVIHAYEHRSYELWWKPRLAHPRYGKLWERIYAFHLTHHVQPRSNQAVSGFLGFPLADILLGTYKKTSHVLIDGSIPETTDFDAPPGGALIRALDRIVLKHRHEHLTH